MNKTIMQYFEWYLPADSSLWNKISNDASHLSKIGITALWLPPAYKAAGGVADTGYAVYDLYDLGEFNQKGTIPTKYGTKDEYLHAIEVLHNNNIDVYADIVLNHRLGADETEEVIAIQESFNDRTTETSSPMPILAWTKYNFEARANKYSSFKWNWTHFHGVDWDESNKQSCIYKFYGKHWDEQVDKENGNFDYLMGADVDLNNVDVVEELTNWGKWYIDFTNLDGFRLDAVKHIRSSFYKNWIHDLNEYSQKPLFTIGEYWSTNINSLCNYITETDNQIALFDVPLHYNFFYAANSNGNYDLRTIFDGTLTKFHPELSVTFVDNHDTQPGQSLCSWIPAWFKPIAYSLILLRKQGIPCIFYGDYYGLPVNNISGISPILDKLLYARANFAYGNQIDYFDDPNIIAWVLEGDDNHKDSGLVVILTDNCGGCKYLNVGKNLSDSTLYDITGNIQEPIYVDKDGNGIFYVNGGSVSVWCKKTQNLD